jgi:hypothetical protein
MSHIPAIVAGIARAAREAAETSVTYPGSYLMSSSSRQDLDRPPLSMRPSRELRARAAELTNMAATARTAQARTALETLAARFADLAARRELAETNDETDEA